jgi:hypothetical protein
MKRIVLALLAAVTGLSSARVLAWDYEGHRVVNQLALASLPTNFPAFVRAPAAQERIAYLSGEPDRWRNVPDELPLVHCNGPDHYIDLEALDDYGLSPQSLPIFRYEFAAKLAQARAAHPDKFPVIDPARNRDRTRELIGFVPWTIVEYSGKLKSSFSTLKAFEENGGTPDEIANAQADVLYVMGVMGHFVGDAAQPLHVTIHHHGWIGSNPHGYTTNRSFHQWIDGEYFNKTGGLKFESLRGRIQPARAVGDRTKPEVLFGQVMIYLLESQKQLEPLYQLEKDGKLSAEGEKGLEGRAFLEGQLIKGGQMLGDIWYSAWRQAPEDRYLKQKLIERKNSGPRSL